MARFYPLFSSSSGNCSYIGSEEAGILVDAGVSFKKIRLALEENRIPLEAVKAVFITHTHSDHIKGLKVLSKKLDTEIIAQQTNLDMLLSAQAVAEGTRLTAIDRSVTVQGFKVEVIDTFHDTPASCGYRITAPDGRVCAVCTDTGRVSPEMHDMLAGCSLVMLESNYDEGMLRRGDYPAELKRRILSDRGHLSNDDCARELKALIKCGVTNFVLGHLSPRNNTPEAAESSAKAALSEHVRGEDYLLTIARPEGGAAIIF